MQTSIAAERRPDATGKGHARKLRAAGRLPAVVYGKGQAAVPVHVDPTSLLDVFKQTNDRNTIIHLEVDGESMPTLVREVQRHPLTRRVLHVDFQRVFTDRPVEVDVPIRTEGRAKGMSLGGRIRFSVRTVKVRCAYTDIPAAIVVDITSMEVDDVIHATDLTLPPGVKLMDEREFVVLTLYGKRAELVVLDEEEGEEGEAGEAEADEEAGAE